MANLITSTEALDDTDVWSQNDITVTADTHAAPAFAGPLAGMADTVADNNASVQGVVIGMFYDIAIDTSSWVGSAYIRKDAVTTRWPEIVVNTGGGVSGYANINTSTGASAAGSTAPDAFGVVDVDATWWRLWLRIVNNGASDNIRMFLFPDHLDGLGGGGRSGGTGSVVVWGFNLTNTSAVQTYEPEPFYLFDPPATTQNLYYRRRR